MLDFENFQIQIAQSPLLSAYANYIPYAVIISEMVIAILLSVPKFRLIGLYASFGIMSAFTVYIYLILNFSDFIPCSCGGILEKMGWTEHLIFNIGSVILAGFAILIQKKEQREKNRDEKTLLKRGFLLMVMGAISSILVIYLFYSSEYIIKKENNFTRRFIPHAIRNPQKIDLGVNSYYFAGQHGDTIFLGNRTAPLLIGQVNPGFDKLLTDTLHIDNASLPFREVKLQVQYPHYNLSDGYTPVIFEGILPNLTASLAMYRKAYFSKAIMVRPHLYIFRAQSSKTRETVMGSLSTRNNNAVKLNDSFLEKQIDGIFDTDGNFIMDSFNQNIIYTYFYRNEYRIMDSTLRLTGKGRTIDTVSHAKLDIVTLRDGSVKLKSPPFKVNQNQAAYKNLLYNESNLRGQHESVKMWQNSSIIDVYHYPTATYQYSFYINREGQDKMRSLLVTSKHLYILSGNQLIRYQRTR
ncbi:hypothetical protein SAMN05444371_3438 [Epilithonimonas mollis]|uniref:Methylamine utilisation protein MauE domain-containing protein n=2 Tax=Epilithonimonas mollis TaxID=216903 RepID=A0A1M6URK5_9FLAO|nr:hypothetical protein SAMN05444371_3438 [Epilithonimonas mollis]